MNSDQTENTERTLREDLYVLTDSEGAAGGGLFADGDAVPGDGRVWLGEKALGGAAGVAEDRGAAGLLVGLHPAEALAVDPEADEVVGEAQDQQVDPDVWRPAVALEWGTEIKIKTLPC